MNYHTVWILKYNFGQTFRWTKWTPVEADPYYSHRLRDRHGDVRDVRLLSCQRVRRAQRDDGRWTVELVGVTDHTEAGGNRMFIGRCHHLRQGVAHGNRRRVSDPALSAHDGKG